MFTVEKPNIQHQFSCSTQPPKLTTPSGRMPSGKSVRFADFPLPGHQSSEGHKSQAPFPKSTLSERLAYPFTAACRRSANHATFGALSGLVGIGIITTTMTKAFGIALGGAIGGLVKLANRIINEDADTVKYGQVIGGVIGTAVGAVMAVPAGAAGALIFTVVGQLINIRKLPMDVFRAYSSDSLVYDKLYFNKVITFGSDLLEEMIKTLTEVFEDNNYPSMLYDQALKTLNIEAEGLTIEKLKKHYREEARTRHPDKVQPEQTERATEDFKKLNKAYNTLLEVLKAPDIN